MRLVPANREDIRGVYKKTENLKILEEFANSGMDCAKIEGLEGREASQISGSLRNSAKRYGYHNIIPVTRGGVVYLLKKEDE